MTGDYFLIPYSFHKFETCFLFCALSIIISDWASVLYDIREYQLYPFLVRKWSLIIINVMFFVISAINFVLLFTVTDMDSYTASPIYYFMIFFQVAISILVTCFMLHAGLKLYFRIHKASGNSLETSNHGGNSGRRRNSNNNSYSTPISTPTTFSRKNMLPLPPLPSTAAGAIILEDEDLLQVSSGSTTCTGGTGIGRNSNSSKQRMSQSNNSSHSSSMQSIASAFNQSIRNSLARFPLLGNKLSNTHGSDPNLTATTTATTDTTMVTSNTTTTNITNGTNGTNNSGIEFRNALRTLNMVMATCTLCIGLQVLSPIPYPYVPYSVSYCYDMICDML